MLNGRVAKLEVCVARPADPVRAIPVFPLPTAGSSGRKDAKQLSTRVREALSMECTATCQAQCGGGGEKATGNSRTCMLSHSWAYALKDRTQESDAPSGSLLGLEISDCFKAVDAGHYPQFYPNSLKMFSMLFVPVVQKAAKQDDPLRTQTQLSNDHLRGF